MHIAGNYFKKNKKGFKCREPEEIIKAKETQYRSETVLIT